MENFEKIITYTDGASRGNPGPAALGAVICDPNGKILKEYSQALGRKTNNEAEYEAVIFALKKVKQLVGKEKAKKMNVEMRMDSEFVVKQMTGKYKVEEERMALLFIAVWNLKLDFANVDFVHVRREQNKDADRLANEALDEARGELWGKN